MELALEGAIFVRAHSIALPAASLPLSCFFVTANQ